MKYIPRILAAITILASASCSNDNSNKQQDTPIAKNETYTNPVIEYDAPDPSVILADDGYYYLYSTGHGYSIFRSKNLVDWDRVGSVFNDETWPAAVRNNRKGDLWAPEIRRIAGKYVIFYTLWFGDVKYSLIGYATADSPQGPFTDKGILIDSQEIGVEQSIDQFYFEDEGQPWIFWGSFRNLYAMQLDVTDDAVITPKPETKQLFAGTAFEGTTIHKHNGWYYFIASTGDFSGGTNSTYRTVMARSKNLLGPYLDKNGQNILDNGFSLLLDKSDNFSGPGHNSNLIEDAEGRTWMLYHAYDNSRPDAGRLGMLDEIIWDDNGWPLIAGGRPSNVAKRPSTTSK